MHGIATTPSYVIMQPTTLCNLDCEYCYLPLRSSNRVMSLEVAAEVAVTVNQWAQRAPRYSVVWHGGEPLSAGRDRLSQLMAPFQGVEHHIQTNATLIDDAWCQFFAEHEVRLGVSIDGSAARTAARVDRGGKPAYEKIMRGIAALKRNEIPFAALCVVSDPQPGLGTELFEFFGDLGCHALGINLEEQEGVNRRSNELDQDRARGFWSEMTEAWRKDPSIELRDVEWALWYAGATLSGLEDTLLPRQIDPVPAVGYDGSVTLLSPELAGFSDAKYGDFASGNVLRTPLDEIIDDVATSPVGWVAEFLGGVEDCRASCAYFGFCGGAHAANRYFERGRFDGTETNHCRNSKISLLEGVLDYGRSR
jgi:uncharacterized protein